MWKLLVIALSLPPLRGTVRDASTGQPIPGVNVHVAGTLIGTTTDSSGRFQLVTPSSAADRVELRFSRIGYQAATVLVRDSVLDVSLVPAARSLEGVTVTALRGEGGRTIAIPQTLLTRDDIAWRYSGQELPLLLTSAPSMSAYSDGGAYSNYTYFRIRGIDQTRVNITLDGVPLNDAEDQGVFFSNFPDLANSLQSVQVQRGVGTSSHGVAGYAGALHLESIALGASTRGGEVQLSRGAFQTTRASGEWHSGRVAERFAAYGRLSWQETDGYRYHAGNRSTGGFFSAGYFGDRTSAKLTAVTGVSRNQLAYLASPIDEIRTDPRHNPLPPQDRDRFTQTVASLAVTRLIGARATLSATAYRVAAGGDYDVTFGPGVSNFNLKSRMTGLFVTYNREAGGTVSTLGLHANTYARDHFLFERPDLTTELYRNTGQKQEASLFGKISREMGRVTATADVQLRHAWYRYVPDRGADIPARSIDWSFFNPKLGLAYALGSQSSLFAAVGSNGREPTRNDMFAGFDNVDTTNRDFVGALTRVKAERVRDVELGWTRRGAVLVVSLTAFAMSFRNEITPIGALSYIGLPLRKNVRASYRRGLEVDAMYRGVDRLMLGANVGWSRNRLAEFTNDASGQTFGNVPPLLTPALIANQTVRLQATRSATVGLEGRYVSRSFLANDGDTRFVVPPSATLDASLGQRWRGAEFLVQLRNAFDRRYFTGGYHDSVVPSYYVGAGRNVMVTAALRF
jgi:iron complex outermembrane receptor protein